VGDGASVCGQCHSGYVRGEWAAVRGDCGWRRQGFEIGIWRRLRCVRFAKAEARKVKDELLCRVEGVAGARTRTAFGSTSISTGAGPKISPSPWKRHSRSVVKRTRAALTRVTYDSGRSPRANSPGNAAGNCAALKFRKNKVVSNPSSIRASGARRNPAP